MHIETLAYLFTVSYNNVTEEKPKSYSNQSSIDLRDYSADSTVILINFGNFKELAFWHFRDLTHPNSDY